MISYRDYEDKIMKKEQCKMHSAVGSSLNQIYFDIFLRYYLSRFFFFELLVGFQHCVSSGAFNHHNWKKVLLKYFGNSKCQYLKFKLFDQIIQLRNFKFELWMQTKL